jgi:hypothetical protein
LATTAYFTGVPHLVGEIGDQPAAQPNREQHELTLRVFELRLDEPQGRLLGQVSAGDDEQLLVGQRLVGLGDGALDGEVLVREFLALDRQAQHAHLLDELCLPGPASR